MPEAFMQAEEEAHCLLWVLFAHTGQAYQNTTKVVVRPAWRAHPQLQQPELGLLDRARLLVPLLLGQQDRPQLRRLGPGS